MQKVAITGIVAITILGLAIIGKHNDNYASLVYRACQASRMGQDISEQTCGELQDYYHIEYLCSQRNNLSSNHCWTENKIDG